MAKTILQDTIASLTIIEVQRCYEKKGADIATCLGLTGSRKEKQAMTKKAKALLAARLENEVGVKGSPRRAAFDTYGELVLDKNGRMLAGRALVGRINKLQRMAAREKALFEQRQEAEAAKKEEIEMQEQQRVDANRRLVINIGLGHRRDMAKTFHYQPTRQQCPELRAWEEAWLREVESHWTGQDKVLMKEQARGAAMLDTTRIAEAEATEEKAIPTAAQVQKALGAALAKKLEEVPQTTQQVGDEVVEVVKEETSEEGAAIVDEALAAAREKADAVLSWVQYDQGLSTKWLEEALGKVEAMDDPAAIEERLWALINNLKAKKVVLKEEAQMEPIKFEDVMIAMAEAGLTSEFLIQLANHLNCHNKRARADVMCLLRGQVRGLKKGTLAAIRTHVTQADIIAMAEAAKVRKEAKQEVVAEGAEQKVVTNDVLDNTIEESRAQKGNDTKIEAKRSWGARLKDTLVATIATFSNKFRKNELATWTAKVRKELSGCVAQGVIVCKDGDTEIQDMLLSLFGGIASFNGKYDAEQKAARAAGTTMLPRRVVLSNMLDKVFVEDGKATFEAFALDAVFSCFEEDKLWEFLVNTKFTRGDQVDAGLPMSKSKHFQSVVDTVVQCIKDARACYTEEMHTEMENHIAHLNGDKTWVAKVRKGIRVAGAFALRWTVGLAVGVTFIVGDEIIQNWQAYLVGAGAAAMCTMLFGTGLTLGVILTVGNATFFRAVKKVKQAWNWVRGLFTSKVAAAAA